MQQVHGIWLPDGDTHFPGMLANAAKFWRRPTYQIDKFLACLPYIKNFGHAVDVGAHCGLWSMVMVRCFRQVTAFEPMPHHAECWRKNVTEENAELHEIALGSKNEAVRMIVEKENSGLSKIAANGTLGVTAKSLDRLEPPHIDFIKIDCGGHE